MGLERAAPEYRRGSSDLSAQALASEEVPAIVGASRPLPPVACWEVHQRKGVVSVADPSAFYATVAASSATMFGIGTAILAGRFMALAERAVQLDIERGEFVNDLSGDLSAKWGERQRRDAIADIHDVAVDLRPWVAVPLLLTVVLVVMSVLPLAGLVPDYAMVRGILTVLLIAASVVWVLLVRRLLNAVLHASWAAWYQRQRERDEGRSKGQGFLVSGHPDDLADNIEKSIKTFAPTFAESIRGKWHLKRMRRKRPPKA